MFVDCTYQIMASLCERDEGVHITFSPQLNVFSRICLHMQLLVTNVSAHIHAHYLVSVQFIPFYLPTGHGMNGQSLLKSIG